MKVCLYHCNTQLQETKFIVYFLGMGLQEFCNAWSLSIQLEQIIEEMKKNDFCNSSPCYTMVL